MLICNTSIVSKITKYIYPHYHYKTVILAPPYYVVGTDNYAVLCTHYNRQAKSEAFIILSFDVNTEVWQNDIYFVKNFL